MCVSLSLFSLSVPRCCVGIIVSERGGVGGGMVECLVQQCPPSLHIGFMDLFPGVSVSNGNYVHVVSLDFQYMLL